MGRQLGRAAALVRVPRVQLRLGDAGVQLPGLQAEQVAQVLVMEAGAPDQACVFGMQSQYINSGQCSLSMPRVWVYV